MSEDLRKLIGERVPRVEDERLLKGAGRFTAALDLPGQAHVAFARSPEAHAEVRSLDVGAAIAATGGLCVLTGADYESDGLKTLLQPGSLPAHLAPSPVS